MNEIYYNLCEKNAFLSENYSVHTFEFWIPIEPRGRKSILQQLKANLKLDVYRAGKNDKEISVGEGVKKIITYFKGVEQRGIKRIEFVTMIGAGGQIYNCYLSAIVNPRKLLGYDKFKDICIVPAMDLNKICGELCAVIKEWGFHEEQILDFYLARIDFCTNFQMESQEQAERYLKILQKGRPAYGMMWKKDYDEVAHRSKFSQNEATLLGDRNDLSIYLKAAQMEENSKYYDQDEIEMAAGQIRIEFRTFRRKIHYFERRFDMSYSEDMIECASQLGCSCISKYLRSVYGTGYFASISDARKIIDSSQKSEESKRFMKWVIQETKSNNLEYVWQLCNEEGRKKLFPLFNSLGISPITIPDYCAEEKFENPLTYIQIANVNER